MIKNLIFSSFILLVTTTRAQNTWQQEVNYKINVSLNDVDHSLSAIEKIEKLLRFHINEMIQHYEEVYVSDREWKHLSDPYLSNFQNQRRIYRKRFAAIIEQGIHNNEIKKIDAATAVLIILHAISGIESWHRSKQKISASELEENMVTILVGGLTNQ
jgi:hypothetical protein